MSLTKDERIELREQQIERMKGYVDYKRENKGNLIIITYADGNGNPCAIIYKGTSLNPVSNYRFQSEKGRTEHIQERIESMTAWENMKRDRKEQAKRNDLKVGDILYSSWGYDQTNVDFFQVKQVKTRQVVIQKIASKVVEETGWCSDMVVAVKNAFLENSKEMTKVVNNNTVSLNSYSSAFPWDGKPLNRTSYA